ncbi:hypothetical protein MIR68_003865 [Amoeboaphelidium protococcarum]|nr:hypothetical protein MIR68_003865 [Amoeboaphelidium protococcarum]
MKLPIVILKGKEKQVYDEYFRLATAGSSSSSLQGLPTYEHIYSLLFAKSYLSQYICTRIWEIVGVNAPSTSSVRGSSASLMDQNTFNVLMRLIAVQQQALLRKEFIEPSAGQVSSMFLQESQQYFAIIGEYEHVVSAFISSTGIGQWEPLTDDQQKYSEYFQQLLLHSPSQGQASLVSGEQVLAFYAKSNLQMNVLQRVINLVDIGKIYQISLPQFQVGMFIIEYLLHSIQVLSAEFDRRRMLGMNVPAMSMDHLLPSQLHPQFVSFICSQQKYMKQKLQKADQQSNIVDDLIPQHGVPSKSSQESALEVDDFDKRFPPLEGIDQVPELRSHGSKYLQQRAIDSLKPTLNAEKEQSYSVPKQDDKMVQFGGITGAEQGEQTKADFAQDFTSDRQKLVEKEYAAKLDEINERRTVIMQKQKHLEEKREDLRRKLEVELKVIDTYQQALNLYEQKFQAFKIEQKL